MPHTHGFASTFDDLISKVIAWSTDTDFHGAAAWELIRNEPWPRGTILKAHGFKPNEHFYIGLMPKVIEKGKTYKEWFLQKSVLASSFVWSPDGLNQPGRPFELNGSSLKIGDTKQSITYAFSTGVDEPDIFAESAQALWLGVFKQYSPELAWHEQPGGMTFKDLPIRPIYYTMTGNNNLQRFVPPLFPGAGYPAIGMDFSGPLAGHLEYWLTKDAHRLILVVKNREYWDVAYLGFLQPYHNGEYAFPAVVMGGTSGAVMKGKDVTIMSGTSPSISAGLQFDYRPSNWALMHGIPTFAASPTDDDKALSQVRLMLPDGQWKSFANWVQGETAFSNVLDGKVRDYTYVRNKPERASNIGYYLRPTESLTAGTGHVYRPLGSILTYQMEPIEFVEGTTHVKNLFGRAWRMYWPSARVAQYGEVTIDDKLHLMLPNAWEGRRISLSHGRTTGNNPDELFAQEKEIEALSRQMNCLIRLED